MQVVDVLFRGWVIVIKQRGQGNFLGYLMTITTIVFN